MGNIKQWIQMRNKNVVCQQQMYITDSSLINQQVKSSIQKQEGQIGEKQGQGIRVFELTFPL